MQQAALKVGISLRLATLNISTDEAELRPEYAAIRDDHVDAVAIAEGPTAFTNRELIVKLVDELQLPAIYPFREFEDAGGLMAYSVDVSSQWRQIARQVDQILKGAKRSEIPFYQATTFEVVINLKTAKALSLTLPPTVLVRANEVIE